MQLRFDAQTKEMIISGTSQVHVEVILDKMKLSLIHISEPTRLLSISYAVFCLKKKK